MGTEPFEGETHSFIVADEAAGTRLDVWLHGHLTDLSRSLLKRYILEERVTVDGACAKPSTLLKEGSRVEVQVPAPPPVQPLPESIPLSILYEDRAIIVLNKPPGIVVHPSWEGLAGGGTIVNALLGHTDELSQEAGLLRPGIVHRLDRETSGVLVVARNDAAHRHLAAQFKARSVAKEYQAFVHGVPAAAAGEVDLPLGRSPVNRKKWGVRTDESAKESHTAWRLERTIGGCSWLRVFPTTGRTHQIRIHLKSIGHPIVCDNMYGRERTITRSEIFERHPQGPEEPILERQALHASRLRIRHPDDERILEFEAALPEDLQRLWELTSEGY